MAYEANRQNSSRQGQPQQQPQSQDERNVQNNANNIRNAAKVAKASGNPYAMAAGKAVEMADKISGGKSTEMAGKALNRANKMMPGGQQAQNALNKMSESGAGDKIGQAADMKSGDAAGAADTASKAKNASEKAADKASSSSSSGSKFGGGLSGFGGDKPSSFLDDGDDGGGAESDPADTMFQFSGKIEFKVAMVFLLPVVGILLLFLVLSGATGGTVSDFNDALGASSVSGGETGEIEVEPASKEAKQFYERINVVKLSMQASGKSVDALKIAAVYHIINNNNNEYDYDYMTTPRIYEIASAMFDGNTYSEDAFKENLANTVFVDYFPKASQNKREQMADDVFDYIERYYSFIGNKNSSCANVGACNYDIKGFYIPGSGNISKPMQISNLQVRLMECGSPFGNGSYNKPIDQDLVPFEEYVAGVANAEIGSYAPMEALKAQMVVARSFALARPTGMGNALGKKLEEENGQWILQISSCVADQVFCNINEGCSFMGGGDGQGGICRSGKVPGAVRTRDALAQDHQLRTAAAATVGEVLVNDEGYIIQSGYLADVSNKFTSYANQGMNYKQILLQVYNSGSRQYGAADVQKMSCNTSGSSNCGSASTGPYASWKQYEGPWTTIQLGNSGQNIRQIGCLVTSVAMLIAKSGVDTVIDDFNPGTFVEHLNKNGGFAGGGNFVWSSVSSAAPTFTYQNQMGIAGYSRQQKLNTISDLLNQGYYVVAEVKGNTGQHWVAIDAISGSNVIMMDPGSASTDMWAQYDWRNTSRLAYFKAG